MATDYGALGPWAGAAAAGYDRAHAEKLQRATQNALAGYGQDPDTAVKNFMAVDAPAAIGLQQQLTQQRAAMATQQEESRKRALAAITGATDMLRKVRDSGGDVGSAYDHLDQGGILDTLGMSPQEKAQYRAAIVANPALIDIISQKAAEGVVLAQGAQLRDKNTGRLLGENPMTPKPLVVRRGDGGSDVIYPTPPGGAPGAAPGVVPGGVPAASGAPLTVETARPLFKAQESSGNYGAVNKDTGALGAYQVMPNTGAAIAKQLGLAWRPDMMTRDDPASVRYQDAIGGAAIKEALNASGGDPRTAFMYYYGGPDRSKWGPKTRQYADEMLARSGGANAAPQNAGVAYSTPGAPPKPKEAPAGYRFKPDGSLEFIPGGPADPGVKGPGKGDKAKTQALAAADQIDSAISAAQDLLNNKDIDSYLGNFQGRLPSWISSGRNDFNRDLEALKTKVGINALQTMRAMSPTGGALGQVSDFENKMLQQSLASLDTTQSEDQFKKNLQKVIGSFQKMKQRLLTEVPNGDTAQSAAPVRVRTVQQAMALPPGTVFITPDGRRKVR